MINRKIRGKNVTARTFDAIKKSIFRGILLNHAILAHMIESKVPINSNNNVINKKKLS